MNEPPRFRVWTFLRAYRGRAALVLGIVAINTFLGLLNPVFVQLLIDRIIRDAREDRLWIFATAFAGVAVFRFLTGILQALTYTAVTTRVLFDLRVDFLAHLQRLPLSFFGGSRLGDIITRFNRDLSVIQELSTGAVLAFITHTLTLIGTVAWALYYEASLFLWAVIPLPLAVLVARLFRGRLEGQTRKMREWASDLASVVLETLGAIRIVRVFQRERGELARFARSGHRLIRGALALQLTKALGSGIPRLCFVVSTITVYALGGAWVIRGELPLGELVAVGMYVSMTFAPLQSLVEIYYQLIQGRVSLARVKELRELPAGPPESPTAPRPDLASGHVRFEGVSFRHDPARPLLESVDLDIPSGQTIGIVGPNGSGKSTLADLLFRFMDPRDGVIRIDGHDLRAIRMDRMRRRMSAVTGDTLLFHTTIAENIRFADPLAPAEAIARAADLAGVLSFAARLEHGLDTSVGEGGLQLSHGERTRVGLARAFLVEPRILVLDEALAALDLANDERLRAVLEDTHRDTTTIIIAPRETDIGKVDRMFWLSNGRLEPR